MLQTIQLNEGLECNKFGLSNPDCSQKSSINNKPLHGIDEPQYNQISAMVSNRKLCNKKKQ